MLTLAKFLLKEIHRVALLIFVQQIICRKRFQWFYFMNGGMRWRENLAASEMTNRKTD